MIKERHITINSSMADILTVTQFVEDICDHYNIFNTYFSNILTAVTEAVQNAIQHGNHNNPSRKVAVVFHSRNDGLSFTISDEGAGFDPESLPDPTDLSNDGMAGRGLFVMKSLSDDMTFSNGGRTVELFFNITGIDQELVSNRMSQMSQYFQSVKKTSGSSIQ